MLLKIKKMLHKIKENLDENNAIYKDKQFATPYYSHHHIHPSL
jgi:hypothetical protein